MAEDIKYQINVQMMDNAVTTDDPNDKIFTVVSNGTADKERIVSEMMAVNPGLERETLRMVLDLENRVIKRLVLSGMRVNNGLVEMAAQCRGVVHGTAWDPSVNSLYVNVNQGKELREAIAATTVNVVGEKGATMYFSTGTGSGQRSGSTFTATAGAPFTLTGRNIKVAGDDPAVGITFSNSTGTTTRVANNMVAVNQPSKLVFVVPASLTDGAYTLTVTTQYNPSSLLKTPRSVSREIVIGPAEGEGSDSESPDEI